MHFCVYWGGNSHKQIVNPKLEIKTLVIYWLFVINPEKMRVFARLLMYLIKFFINILTDFVTSHQIAFYSKLYDIDRNCYMIEHILHYMCTNFD